LRRWREGGVIHRAPGTYEEVVEYSGAEADKRGWYNANPGTLENRITSIEAYATIAYQTAYLKTHYPVEFMASLLTSEKADVERIGVLIGECKKMNIEVQ